MSQKVVVVNAGKMDFDGQLDFSILSDDVQVYQNSTNEEFIERIQGATAVVTKEYPVPAELMAQFPDTVKLIVEAGTGYNNIDLDAARSHGITVCNIPAYSTERVAHTVIMMLLNLASTMQQQIAMLARGDRSNFTKHLQVPHTEVNGKTLGIIGAGHIGLEVIKVARALGMNILIHTRTPKEDSEGIRYVSFETLMSESDYISLHCPLNDKTKYMIDKKAISLMKPTAFIINTGRGALINEADLIEALQNKAIGGAGLDVQEVEPPAEDSPLYTLENVIITPHMGWKGFETRQRLVGIISDDIHGFFEGKPVNVVS
ncbi:NAD(P)-dependent oxidoreductase [Veillonella sp. YH-vei2232]|jgi:glycerate dehydrogenase|uniref:NAD(P)-dependent oxidoreductase n=1 Tax=Veillonella absiana TaxID=3079305 RepID=A0ABU3Z6D8_9FIRM|nr:MULTISPECIES: NAD(P)-dependent oxidoreductase [unclassified Veillonella]MBK7921000.1 D-2-hydroxyacid dehydrogenase [Veillonella sp.]MBP6923403.1 D-2-hydroxyacid dehydrogenase [Veillonella sp.]MBP8616964.1 D-2-hydroxyacid dehydrogenase [Veillonella sp.]MBP9517330.1 D-2-hydroxyacid dehydrogenase [Veillonella sp.]MBP9550712.1 D-2-hydroxyacid dehydrogenase [Veillonella sp.]